MPYYNRDPKRGHNFDNHPYNIFGPYFFEEVPHLRMYNISRKAAPNLWKPGLAWGAGVGKKERAIAKVSGISGLLKARLCG